MDKWLFWSDRGEGKTSVMVQMANDLSNSGYKVTFISSTDENLNLVRDVNHLLCGGDRNDTYTLAVITEKAKLGRIDFLFVDDIGMSSLSTITILDVSCHVVISTSSFDSGPIREKVPIHLIGKENFLEVTSLGKLPKDFIFKQTFNSNVDIEKTTSSSRSIKYVDIVNRYLRDKKIEQLI